MKAYKISNVLKYCLQDIFHFCTVTSKYILQLFDILQPVLIAKMQIFPSTGACLCAGICTLILQTMPARECFIIFSFTFKGTVNVILPDPPGRPER